MLHQTAKVIGLGWDTSRIRRNDAGQIVYTTGLRISPSSLIFQCSIRYDTCSYKWFSELHL